MRKKLRASRNYQAKNMATDGSAKTESSAGIALYSVSSSQRANAQTRKDVQKILKDDITEAEKRDAKKLQEKLEKNGVDKNVAYDMASGYSSYNAAADQNETMTTYSGGLATMEEKSS